MTNDERRELRQIQETLIVALAKVTKILGISKSSKPIESEDNSEAKERWIAP